MAHLLVVDDEPSARTTLALLLRKRGHRVVEADGATSAAAKLSDEAFDLVVTDLRMPDGDGLDVLRAAKAHAPATEVILLTAYADTTAATSLFPPFIPSGPVVRAVRGTAWSSPPWSNPS